MHVPQLHVLYRFPFAHLHSPLHLLLALPRHSDSTLSLVLQHITIDGDNSYLFGLAVHHHALPLLHLLLLLLLPLLLTNPAPAIWAWHGRLRQALTLPRGVSG